MSFGAHYKMPRLWNTFCKIAFSFFLTNNVLICQNMPMTKYHCSSNTCATIAACWYWTILSPFCKLDNVLVSIVRATKLMGD